MDITMQFIETPGFPPCLVFSRRDKHHLSLSARDKSLVHFDERGGTVKNYGAFTTTEGLIAAIDAFGKEA